MRKLLTVAATIVVPYALWPLVMVWAVLYFSTLGLKRVFAMTVGARGRATAIRLPQPGVSSPAVNAVRSAHIGLADDRVAGM